MRGKKKIFSLVLLLVLVLPIFVGCSNSTTEGKNKAVNNFPEKNLTIICPFSAGGGTDGVSRAIADSAKEQLGQPVVVENKTGGVGVIGMTEGMKAKKDGYTLTMVTVELVTLPKLGLAPDTFSYKEFTPIALLNGDPSAITVSVDAPWNTMEEFITYAKEHPSEVTLGNAGSGSIWHLAAIGLENATGAEFKHVPYQGGANPAVVDLLGGHIDAVAVSPAEVAPHVEAGKLKILGIASDNRADRFPEVKTYKEQGIDLSIGTWRGLAVPKDTPEEIVNILQDKITNAANDSKFVEFLQNAGLGLDVRNSEQFLEKLESEDKVFDGIAKVYSEQTK